jgi:hypothetical protein
MFVLANRILLIVTLTNRKRDLAHYPLNTGTMARGMIPATLLVSRSDLIGCYADQWEEETGPSFLEQGNEGPRKDSCNTIGQPFASYWLLR